MKPARWNYDLAKPVLAEYSFCLSNQGMPDIVKQHYTYMQLHDFIFYLLHLIMDVIWNSLS